MKKITLVILLLVLTSVLAGCPWWHHGGDHGGRHGDGHDRGHYEKGR